jgi:hypothetical protein
MVRSECPICRAAITFTRSVDIDQCVACVGCGNLLKVASTSPLKLIWVLDDLLEAPEFPVRSFPNRWNRFPY